MDRDRKNLLIQTPVLTRTELINQNNYTIYKITFIQQAENFHYHLKRRIIC